jgi:small subunit ribosomal protein S20
MPHTKSAKKNLRKSEKRRRQNRVAKRDIKEQLKSFEQALQGPIEKLREEYNKTAKRLDKAAAKKVIHSNLAARKKSQLARQVNARTTAGKQPTPAAPTKK